MTRLCKNTSKIIKLEARSISESSVRTWAVFNFHVWCSHSHCLQRIRTLLVSAPCLQGRISALGVVEGSKLWETTMICQICGKVAMIVLTLQRCAEFAGNRLIC